MIGSIASMAAASAASALSNHNAELELMSHMTPKQKEVYAERRKQQQEFDLRRREVVAAETRELSGYGPGALFLAFLFGSSL